MTSVSASDASAAPVDGGAVFGSTPRHPVAGPRRAAHPSAQQQVIRGRVTDAQSQQPIPGVNVVVPQTTIGTSTDRNGEYSLDVPAETDSLVFSAVGYQTQRVAIDGRSVINVQLSADVALLEEVVVVGYGTQQRQEVTGSVSSVTSQDIENFPVDNFESAIQGQISGVQINERTGEPGAATEIEVRGTGSISGGNTPLFVIDGLPIGKSVTSQGSLFRRRAAFTPPFQNPLSVINPKDIESIEVLKDAAATSIYGSRGANGVVLISTKRGREGTPVVRVNQRVSLEQVAHTPDMMNSAEWVEYVIDSRNTLFREEFGFDPPNPRTNEGRPEDNALLLIPEKAIEFDQGARDTDTDWLDLLFEDAYTTESHVSVTGGSQSVGYYVAGGALLQEGILEGSSFDRYTLRANINADVNPRINFQTNLNISSSQQDRVSASGPYFARPPGVVYSAQTSAPVVEPFNTDGTPNQRDGQAFLGGGTTSNSNPFAILQGISEELDHERIFGTAAVDYNVWQNVILTTRFGADLSNYTRDFFRGNSLLFRTATEGEPFGQSASTRTLNWLSETTANYTGDFGDHSVTGLVGFTAQRQTDDQNSVIAVNFPDDEVPTINAGQVVDGSSFTEEWSLLSYLARGTYSFRDRYLFTGSIRADKSSRFGDENQTGIFPSLSVGWRMSEEDFMADVPQVSNLKLRASFGKTGNFLIPNSGAFSLLGAADYVTGDGQQVRSGVAPSTLGDDELSWETTREFNVGLDLGLYNDRVELLADYYRSTTEDLLLNVAIPAQTGFTSVLTNIGEVENEGLELELSTRNITGDFSWDTSFNFSTNRNEVTALGPDGAPIRSVGAAGIRHITQIGNEIGSYWGHKVDGIYQSEEDIASAPEDLLAPDPAPGDFKFRDINGDGVIDQDDRTITGSYQPDWTFGLTNTFRWRGFDLSVFFNGVVGREILNLTARHMKNGEANFNSYTSFNDRWRSPEEPGDGKTPRADRQTGLHGNNNRPSDFQVEDGDYIRLRTATLGYSFPFDLGGQTRNARVYLTGRNLFIITSYINFNPDASLQTNPLVTGEDYGAFPVPRNFTVGFNLTL